VPKAGQQCGPEFEPTCSPRFSLLSRPASLRRRGGSRTWRSGRPKATKTTRTRKHQKFSQRGAEDYKDTRAARKARCQQSLAHGHTGIYSPPLLCSYDPLLRTRRHGGSLDTTHVSDLIDHLSVLPDTLPATQDRFARPGRQGRPEFQVDLPGVLKFLFCLSPLLL
jgi:hypothetical protein